MRKKSTAPVFGAKGIVSVEWTGELPSPAFGSYYTRKIYRFRTDKNPRLVDKRDLPQLVKEAGRKNLKSKGLPRLKRETKIQTLPAPTRTLSALPAQAGDRQALAGKQASETKPKAED